MIDTLSFSIGFGFALVMVGLAQIAYRAGKLATYRLYKNNTDLDSYFSTDAKNKMLLSLIE